MVLGNLTGLIQIGEPFQRLEARPQPLTKDLNLPTKTRSLRKLPKRIKPESVVREGTVSNPAQVATQVRFAYRNPTATLSAAFNSEPTKPPLTSPSSFTKPETPKAESKWNKMTTACPMPC